LWEPLLDGSLMIHIQTHPIFCDIKRLFSSTIKQDPWSFVPSDNQTWQWVISKCRWCLLLFPPFGDFPLPYGHRRVRCGRSPRCSNDQDVFSDASSSSEGSFLGWVYPRIGAEGKTFSPRGLENPWHMGMGQNPGT
jgi:hypothetical protein